MQVGIYDENKHSLPNSFALSQNYPNPFNPSTVISFDIPGNESENKRAVIRIYDTRGRCVRKILDATLQAGRHRVMWDGRNENGEHVSSGIYFYTLTCENKAFTRKMTMAK